MVICISRESGSGGRDIGVRLAELLGIPYYDSVLINEIDNAGLDQEILAEADERKGRRFISLPKSGVKDPKLKGLTANDIVFEKQSEWICNVAEKGNCVIIGRCADYVLRQNSLPYISIFVCSPMADRVERIAGIEGMDPKEAYVFLNKKDKERRTYYNFYTDGEWGKADNYDLCINSCLLGTEQTALMLANTLRELIDAPDSVFVKRAEE